LWHPGLPIGVWLARATGPAVGPEIEALANLYLIASASGIVACAVRITTALIPPIQTQLGAGLVWLFACLCGAGFA
jgi:hypothetical protein